MLSQWGDFRCCWESCMQDIPVTDKDYSKIFWHGVRNLQDMATWFKDWEGQKIWGAWKFALRLFYQAFIYHKFSRQIFINCYLNCALLPETSLHEYRAGAKQLDPLREKQRPCKKEETMELHFMQWTLKNLFILTRSLTLLLVGRTLESIWQTLHLLFCSFTTKGFFKKQDYFKIHFLARRELVLVNWQLYEITVKNVGSKDS